MVVSTAIGADNPELALARERGLDRHPPRRAARRALRREAADRDRRHPRQDDDDRDGGLGAARPRRGPGLLRRRRGARARPRAARPPTPAGARASGWSPRPTRATAASSRLEPEIAVDHQRRDGPPLELGLARAELIEAFAGFAGKSRVAVLPAPTREGGAVEERPRFALRAAAGERSPVAADRDGRANAPGGGGRVLARGAGADGSSTWRCPGAHNVLNARAALGGARGRRVRPRRRRRGARRLPRGRGAGSSSRASGAASAYMTTTPTTRPRSAPRSRPCASSAPPRLIAVFQPHLYSRTKAFADRVRRRPRRSPTRSRCSTSTRPARSRSARSPASAASRSPGPPPTAAAASRSPGSRPPAAAEAFLADRLEALPRSGSILVTIGAGDIFKLGEAWSGSRGP